MTPEQIHAAIARARQPMRLTNDEAEQLLDALSEGSRAAPVPGALRAVAPGRRKAERRRSLAAERGETR